VITNLQTLGTFLSAVRLLVIPPPTGTYDPDSECWVRCPESLYAPDEICEILRFLRAGGRLLAFSYRFGDSFTQTKPRPALAALAVS